MPRMTKYAAIAATLKKQTVISCANDVQQILSFYPETDLGETTVISVVNDVLQDVHVLCPSITQQDIQDELDRQKTNSNQDNMGHQGLTPNFVHQLFPSSSINPTTKISSRPSLTSNVDDLATSNSLPTSLDASVAEPMSDHDNESINSNNNNIGKTDSINNSPPTAKIIPSLSTKTNFSSVHSTISTQKKAAKPSIPMLSSVSNTSPINHTTRDPSNNSPSTNTLPTNRSTKITNSSTTCTPSPCNQAPLPDDNAITIDNYASKQLSEKSPEYKVTMVDDNKVAQVQILPLRAANTSTETNISHPQTTTNQNTSKDSLSTIQRHILLEPIQKDSTSESQNISPSSTQHKESLPSSSINTASSRTTPMNTVNSTSQSAPSNTALLTTANTNTNPKPITSRKARARKVSKSKPKKTSTRKRKRKIPFEIPGEVPAPEARVSRREAKKKRTAEEKAIRHEVIRQCIQKLDQARKDSPNLVRAPRGSMPLVLKEAHKTCPDITPEDIYYEMKKMRKKNEKEDASITDYYPGHSTSLDTCGAIQGDTEDTNTSVGESTGNTDVDKVSKQPQEKCIRRETIVRIVNELERVKECSSEQSRAPRGSITKLLSDVQKIFPDITRDDIYAEMRKRKKHGNSQSNSNVAATTTATATIDATITDKDQNTDDLNKEVDENTKKEREKKRKDTLIRCANDVEKLLQQFGEKVPYESVTSILKEAQKTHPDITRNEIYGEIRRQREKIELSIVETYADDDDRLNKKIPGSDAFVAAKSEAFKLYQIETMRVKKGNKMKSGKIYEIIDLVSKRYKLTPNEVITPSALRKRVKRQRQKLCKAAAATASVDHEADKKKAESDKKKAEVREERRILRDAAIRCADESEKLRETVLPGKPLPKNAIANLVTEAQKECPQLTRKHVYREIDRRRDLKKKSSSDYEPPNGLIEEPSIDNIVNDLNNAIPQGISITDDDVESLLDTSNGQDDATLMANIISPEVELAPNNCHESLSEDDKQKLLRIETIQTFANKVTAMQEAPERKRLRMMSNLLREAQVICPSVTRNDIYNELKRRQEARILLE